MVIVRLMGGLGNQMFQYAVARALSIRSNRSLALDRSWYDDVAGRRYCLSEFNVQETLAAPEDTACFQRLRDYPKTRGRRVLEWAIPGCASHYVRERERSYDPGQFPARGSLYLDGYWQSYRYFSEYEDEIRQDFTLRTASTVNASAVWGTLGANSVAIHVRRGDYVSDTAANRTHGTCSLDYYSRAIFKMARLVARPDFFVFSDDPEWSRRHLKIEYPTTFVSDGGDRSECIELRLMTQCRHFIIANSTFSWWGAYLSQSPHKVVIAPRRWFAREDYRNPDLLPRDWIQL